MRFGRLAAEYTGAAALYAWFTVTATRDEGLAALAVALVAGITVARIRRVTACRAAVPVAGWLALATRAPYAVIRESLDLLGPVLFAAVRMRRRQTGRWIALRYTPEGPAPADGFGRRALVIFGSSLTPNALPVDIDDERGRLVLHQLVPRRESAAGDPQLPL